jgi:hypothetical protein
VHRQKLARCAAEDMERLRNVKRVGLIKTKRPCGSEVCAEMLEHFVDFGEAAEMTLTGAHGEFGVLQA